MARWGGETRSPLKGRLKLPMATMGQSVTKVVMWEWAGLCTRGRQKGKELCPRASPLLGQSPGLAHLTRHVRSEPGRARWGNGAGTDPGDTLHGEVGWWLGVWETLDTNRYPPPSMVPRESPCGLNLPTESPRDWGKPQAKHNGEPKGDINDMLSPWPSLSLLLALTKAVSAAQQVRLSSVLPVDNSDPFPPQPRVCTQ